MPDSVDDNLRRLAELRPPSLARCPITPGNLERQCKAAAEYLAAARNESNALRVRFSSAAEAAHMVLIAALEARGYKPSREKGHRQVVFDLATQLLTITARDAAFLRDMHGLRNESIYDAAAPASASDTAALIEITGQLLSQISPPKATSPVP